MVRFVKMHGAGNDYVYVDGFRECVDDPARLARAISRPHFGVGSDGLILVLPSERADVRMRMWNADGSEAEMCGNGVRCVAKLAHEAGYAPRDDVRVEVGREGASRVLAIRVEKEGGRVRAARVDMGPPDFVRARIPVAGEPAGGEAIDVEVALPARGRVFRASCVSMGNPHCVIFLDAPAGDDLVLGLGPEIERHPLFPARVNVGFAHVAGPDEIRLRVFERGSGETLACGTGACAALAAAARTGRTGRRARVRLPGGDLEIEWSEATGSIALTGPCVEVFRGEYAEG
jgi:diaminopimelate epimerase